MRTHTDAEGNVWEVVEPKTGGLLLKRPGAIQWTSRSELARMESRAFEGLVVRGERLVRVS